MDEKGHFADLLRQLRHGANLTQDELADRSGVTVGVIRQYEQGRREPGYSALVKLARGLGTTIGAFHPPDVEPAPAKKPTRKKKP